jgi:hypothetical protein
VQEMMNLVRRSFKRRCKNMEKMKVVVMHP